MNAIDDPVILIRPTRLLQAGMTTKDALYEAARGVWRVGIRREAARLALTVDRVTVLEVCEIERWLPAGTTAYKYRPANEVQRPGRYEFVGRVADPDARQRYIGMDVKDLLPRGAQNPIKYVNC